MDLKSSGGPFEFVKKQSWCSPAKLFICRDSTINSDAKTPNEIQLTATSPDSYPRIDMRHISNT